MAHRGHGPARNNHIASCEKFGEKKGESSRKNTPKTLDREKTDVDAREGQSYATLSTCPDRSRRLATSSNACWPIFNRGRVNGCR